LVLKINKNFFFTPARHTARTDTASGAARAPYAVRTSFARRLAGNRNSERISC
jgi:hypothetical protein